MVGIEAARSDAARLAADSIGTRRRGRRRSRRDGPTGSGGSRREPGRGVGRRAGRAAQRDVGRRDPRRRRTHRSMRDPTRRHDAYAYGMPLTRQTCVEISGRAGRIRRRRRAGRSGRGSAAGPRGPWRRGGRAGRRISPLPRPRRASAVFTGIGFGARPSRSRQSGKSLAWSRAGLGQVAALEGVEQRDHVAGDQVGDDRDDPLGPHGEHRQGQAVVPREDRQVGPGEDVADLVERAARLLDGDDRADLREPLDRLRVDVPARSAPGRCRGRAAGRRSRRSGRSGRRALPGSAGCSRGRRPGRRRPRPWRRTGSGGRPRPSSSSRSRPAPWPGPRPRSTTAAITRSCSSCVSVGDSPVVPTGLSTGVPCAICQSTDARRAW